MTLQTIIRNDQNLTTDEGLRSAVATFVEAGEAPLSDLPLPGEITDLALILLAAAALLGPGDGDDAPIEDVHRAALKDLDFAWTF
jgi:hypothetical protein